MSNSLFLEDLGYLLPKESSKHKVKFGLYLCECGNTFKAMIHNMNKRPETKCGCYAARKSKERQTTHGLKGHKIYAAWRAMKGRCLNKNTKNFDSYGGRGILVCDKWLHSFEEFRDDMLPSWKEGLSLDRIDVNGNYEPSNCRWATREVQARNTRLLNSANTSGYRGVCYHSRDKCWTSSIYVSAKPIYLGNFDTAAEAAVAYNTYIELNHLEHPTNPIDLDDNSRTN